MVAIAEADPKDLAAFRASLPSRLRVTLATPCDDGHKRCYWRSLCDLIRAVPGLPFDLRDWTPPGDSLVTRGRDHIAHEFYELTADDYLLFIDSDIDFRVADVIALVNRRLPLVCGLYAIKQQELRWCINTIKDEIPDPVTKLQKIAAAGTGFLLIHRSVIGRMIAGAEQWPHWRMAYLDDATKSLRHHLFADVVIDDPAEFEFNPRRLSEDWSFCYHARKLGFDVWADTEIITLHCGETMYPVGSRRQTREEVLANTAPR